MTERVFLTGARGLVGRAVARQLRDAGDRVVGIDRQGGDVDGWEVIECDVTNAHRLHELALLHGFTAIVHCAAYSGPMVGSDNPGAVIETNLGGTANLLEVARIHDIPRVVFCSSVSAVGPTSAPITEDVPLRPTSVYAATKAASEALIHAYRERYDLQAVSLRLSAVWGPERTTVCALGQMITDAVAGRETVFAQGADAPTQYLHVTDAARAVQAALTAERLPKPVYHVNGGEYLTMAEVADLVRAEIPTERITIGPGPDPMYDWQEPFLIDAARADLGFEPRVSLAAGIREFADRLRAATAAPAEPTPKVPVP